MTYKETKFVTNITKKQEPSNNLLMSIMPNKTKQLLHFSFLKG